MSLSCTVRHMCCTIHWKQVKKCDSTDSSSGKDAAAVGSSLFAICDSEVNTVWPKTTAVSLVSAVAWGCEKNSKDSKHRRWKQQKKTFNICCLKAASLLLSHKSSFVVAELDVSAGPNNITLQTVSSKRAKAEVSLFLHSERLYLCDSMDTYFPYSLAANFHLTKRCSLCNRVPSPHLPFH